MVNLEKRNPRDTRKLCDCLVSRNVYNIAIEVEEFILLKTVQILNKLEYATSFITNSSGVTHPHVKELYEPEVDASRNKGIFYECAELSSLIVSAGDLAIYTSGIIAIAQWEGQTGSLK